MIDAVQPLRNTDATELKCTSKGYTYVSLGSMSIEQGVEAGGRANGRRTTQCRPVSETGHYTFRSGSD